MNKYSIYCTEEQTRKALELGAPIIEWEFNRKPVPYRICEEHKLFCISGRYYEIPTAEQMIGWLEDQDYIDSIEIERLIDDGMWKYFVFTTHSMKKDKHFTRRDATISAIDAALEYLSNIKEE